jgi:hypothetical protein
MRGSVGAAAILPVIIGQARDSAAIAILHRDDEPAPQDLVAMPSSNEQA